MPIHLAAKGYDEYEEVALRISDKNSFEDFNELVSSKIYKQEVNKLNLSDYKLSFFERVRSRRISREEAREMDKYYYEQTQLIESKLIWEVTNCTIKKHLKFTYGNPPSIKREKLLGLINSYENSHKFLLFRFGCKGANLQNFTIEVQAYNNVKDIQGSVSSERKGSSNKYSSNIQYRNEAICKKTNLFNPKNEKWGILHEMCCVKESLKQMNKRIFFNPAFDYECNHSTVIMTDDSNYFNNIQRHRIKDEVYFDRGTSCCP